MYYNIGRCLIGAILLMGCGQQALSAPLNPADQDVIESQQKALLEQTQRQREALQSSVTLTVLPIVTLRTANGSCQQVREIIIKGSDKLSAVERQKLAKPWLARCMGLDDIRHLGTVNPIAGDSTSTKLIMV